MARPQKEGIDYFSLDVDMDDNFELIEAEHGIVGFGVIIKLYQKIYSESYYYPWTKKEQLLFSKRISVGKNTVIAIVSDCINWGIFDRKLFEKYGILTSRGIQKRYISATVKRASVELIKKYMLVDIPKRNNITLKNISSCDNEVSSGRLTEETEVSGVKSTQSKVKESKGKESKVEEDENNKSGDAIKFYNENFELITRHVSEEIGTFLDDGLADNLIVRAMQEAINNGAKSWAYVKKILNRCFDKGIKTVEAFETDKKNFEANKIRGSTKKSNVTYNDFEHKHDDSIYLHNFYNNEGEN